MLNELFSYGCLTLKEINEINLLTARFLTDLKTTRCNTFTSIVFLYHSMYSLGSFG